MPENVDHPGWQAGAPPLAVEYSDHGIDEADLQQEIIELHTAGTQYVWVVRLAASPKFVEVHPNGKPMYIVDQDGELEAKGILANKVPVRALYERDAALRVVRRNVLGGYKSLEAVLQAGRQEGMRAAVKRLALRANVGLGDLEVALLNEDGLLQLLDDLASRLSR